MSPDTAEVRSHAMRMSACVLMVGTRDPTWNFEIINMLRIMLTTDLVELITSGTSG